MKKKATQKKLPTFDVFRPIECSDGISEWTHYTPDTTIPWTADETAAWEKICDEDRPRERILRMQAQLAALEPITNPFIQLHVDTIREIHARLKRLAEIPPQMTVDEWMHWSEHDRATKQLQVMEEFSEEDKRLLLDVDEAWQKIVTIRDVVPVRAQRDKALADGPTAAAKKRKIEAAKNRAKLDKAITDLLLNNGPAKDWSAKDVNDYLRKRHDYGYTEGTMLKYVNEELARIHQKN